MKKIGIYSIISLAVLLIINYAGIWYKYAYKYKSYKQEEIYELFKEKGLPIPVFKTIEQDDIVIRYLTNDRKEWQMDDEEGKDNINPHLILTPKNGDSAKDFLNYFLDKKLTNNLNLIAIDSIGFINYPEENKHYTKYHYLEENNRRLNLLEDLYKTILYRERVFPKEVRVVFGGETSAISISAFRIMLSTEFKFFALDSDLSKRFFITKWYSYILVNTGIKKLFPKPYINKHNLLLLNDLAQESAMDYVINSLYTIETKRNSEERSGYKEGAEGKKLRFMFFNNLNTSSQKKLNELTEPNFFLYLNKKIDLYQPKEVMDLIDYGDQFTLYFNRINAKK